jgi:tripartite-type tricarboxylate transporter receptor subunit TctC
VPYRGGAPAMSDLLGGQVQATFSLIPSSIEYVRARKLRALAVTTATRLDVLPDIPAVANSCRATTPIHGTALARPRAHPRKSSTSSTRKSMPSCWIGLPET